MKDINSKCATVWNCFSSKSDCQARYSSSITTKICGCSIKKFFTHSGDMRKCERWENETHFMDTIVFRSRTLRDSSRKTPLKIYVYLNITFSSGVGAIANGITFFRIRRLWRLLVEKLLHRHNRFLLTITNSMLKINENLCVSWWIAI